MATKKAEMMEQENNVLEQVSPEGMENTEPNTPTEIPEESQESSLEESEDMDLNALLEQLDTDPENEALPGMDEEESFPSELLAELDEDMEMMPTPDNEGVLEKSSSQESPTQVDTAPDKPKRTTRRKKAEITNNTEDIQDNEQEAGQDKALPDTPPPSPGQSPSDTAQEDSMKETSPTIEAPAPPAQTPSRRKSYVTPVLTIENRGEVETESAKEDAIWHEIHNAYRTRKIMTGQLGGIEQMDNGKTIAIVDYKGFRIIIPLKEMMINLGRTPSGQEYTEFMQRQNKILGNMLGAEIDFIVRGIDSKTRSVVASRREAMLKKRQIFYLDTDAAGMYRIYEGRIVQARVIAVAEKVIRVEVFGVECSIMARDLAWDWIGDAHERFSVGDQVLVRILSVRREDLENISVKADIKSVSQNTSHDNLKKCRIQSKYAGKVTDVYKGVVYIRLANGVNAVAHSCFDYRTPGKKDDVSFAVTKLDEERGVAVGIITRIIRQNL